MTRFSRWATTASAMVVASVIACGGTQFTAAANDDAGGQSNQGDAGGSSCVIPPSATGNEADFCAVETKLLDRCGQCEQCHQTDLNNCVALGDALSGTFKSALDACADKIACGDYTTYAGDPCVTVRLTNATPTAAQQSARAQYCAKCDTTDATGCLADFFQPAQPDGGAAGVGLIVLLSNDDIASSIGTTCSGDCGPLAYEACAIGQFCKGQAADACKTGYCGK